MADTCCETACGSGQTLNDPRWRRILWIALILNAMMFVVEMSVGFLAHSRSVQADALDFLGDAANYAISLGVAGMGLRWRAGTALLKGGVILLFGIGVLISAVIGLIYGATPEPFAMGAVGFLALLVNLSVALMLFRYRTGDANMRSVWICSRNDAINNLLVIGAAGIVLWTGSGLPDLAVALIMAILGIWGGWQVVRQAMGELDQTAPRPRRG